MIAEAKKIGCDAVKFQLFSDKEIVNLPMETYEKLKSMILTEEAFLDLKQWGNTCNIDVFASAMYLEAIDILKKAECKFIKIREKDSGNEELLNAAIHSGKFTLVSTVTLPMDVSLLYHPKVRWMLCVPFYPPRERELHLSQAISYRGISDHYPSISSALAATAIILHEYGSNFEFIVEKHVVPEHNPAYVDDAVSVTLNEFADMVKYIRQMTSMSWEATDKKIPTI